MLLTEIDTLDRVLQSHAAELGGDFTAYRNHAYRVANICAAQTARDADSIEKIAIAAVFHDLGIWTDRTFDYVPPSMRLANAYLASADRVGWSPEISEMIVEHHKITRYQDNPSQLVEPFRRADWVDVSRGVLTFGLSRPLLNEILTTWPNAGFHKRLVQLSLKRLSTHPLNPLPMFRL